MTFTFEDVATTFAQQEANRIYYRYKRWGVERDDCLSEIHVWLYGKGKAKVERWLASEPQQTTRIRRSMQDQATGFAEIEKAHKLGYNIDDVAWYSASLVKSMMPFVLDDGYDCDGVIDSPVTSSVIDIRRALDALDDWVREAFLADEDETAEHGSAVQAVISYLGGKRPALGSRRVLSNASAQAITGSDYDD